MNKIILSLLILFIGQSSFAQTIPTYTKPKATSQATNKVKTTDKKTQPTLNASIEPEMVFVEGGTFNMGSNESADEKPIHAVTVSSFNMSKYEVTQAQWKAVMKTNPSSNRDCNNCPVENVRYTDVENFIEELNYKTGNKYRLPTEAEWEFAARGGNNSNNYTFSGSSTLPKVGWAEENSANETHSVGKLRPNELGIYDMTGNVWEMCSDWYDARYYANSPSTNPKGPSMGSSRLHRGGSSWDSFATSRVACRNYRTTDDPVFYIGFRLVSP